MTVLHLTPKDDLQKAIDGLKEPAEIYLAAGIYRQKIEICADGVKIRGEDRGKTVIKYDDYAKKIHADGKEYNTFRTYTVCVTGENVRLENLTIENSNTDPREAGQCVALSVNAKRFFAEGVTLKSMQDTLFLYPFPDDLVVRYDGFIPRKQLYCEGESLHFFNCCDIYGTVDFIFGCAEAYFLNCKIYSLSDPRNIGFIAAPAHSLKQKRGFLFVNCEMKQAGAQDNTCYLARPWRDFGKCEFVNCYLDPHIKPELFDKWNDTERDKTARFGHFGLTPIINVSPVPWARDITLDEAYEIIHVVEEKFNEFLQ